MATPTPDGAKPARNRVTAKSTTDPVLRNALRYTISAKEYQTLHRYIISRSKVLKRNTPTVSQVEKYVDRPGRDDYNAAAVRASIRVFLATAAGLKAWAIIKERLFGGPRTGYIATLLTFRIKLLTAIVKQDNHIGVLQTYDFPSLCPPYSYSTVSCSDFSRVFERIFSHRTRNHSGNATLGRAKC
jgi:hypothetical protein